MTKERILVVDDEPGVREALHGILCDEGFEVVCVDSGEHGLEALSSESFDAVLLDIWLPGIDGLETLERLRERQVDAEVVMISGHGTIETAVKATRRGAFDFVEKPLSLEKTLLVLRNALRQRRLERRNRRLLEQLARDTDVLGSSAAAETIRKQIVSATDSDAPLLIQGEPGSGREAIARRIHSSGRRAREAFVVVPCAAVDGGSGTPLFGAPAEPSRLALAERGTLFLAEVARLPSELQTRLAATLKATDESGPNVRAMASIGPETDGLEDPLRHTLDVIRITVPPLRRRREDIPDLIDRFIGDLAREYGRDAKSLSEDCRGALQSYDWPGNVRELQNVLERLVLMVPGETVGLEDLPAELSGGESTGEDLYREFSSLAEGVERFERYYVRRMLAAAGGELATAARRLGLSDQDLSERIKALGLDVLAR